MQAQLESPAHIDSVRVAVSYYDAMHAAARYDGPAWSFVGYNDLICPAATVLASFNQLSGPKIMTHSVELGHDTPAPLLERSL